MMDGVQRWCFNCKAWKPSPTQLSLCISLLPLDDQRQVARFKKLEDQKRTLISRLMQRMLIHSLLDISYSDVSIFRTPEGKPFVGNIVENSCFPNLNFSVSHHGDFVALASEPHALVGLDIMIPDPEEEAAPEEYIKNFRSCFTLLEWKNINSVGPDKRLLLDQFCRYWCLKESYVKAIGIGLGFDMQRAEFFYKCGNVWSMFAYLRLDGVYQPDWHFYLSQLDTNHWVCTAKGPLAAAITSFKEALHAIDLNGADIDSGSQPPFVRLVIEDLIPCSHAETFRNLKES